MKFLWNGDAAGTKVLYKGANNGVNYFRVLTDDGSTIVSTLTGATVTLELYTDASRSTAAVASLSINDTIDVTNASGIVNEEFLQAVMTFGPGTFYAFLKHVTSGTVTSISTNFFTVVVN